MEIKPPNFGKRPLDPATTEKKNAADKSGKFEGRLKAGENVSAASSSTAAATLEKLKAQFSKSDLEDGPKAETILNRAIDEVLLGGLPENLQLPAGDRRAVADFMAKDPVIRERMMNLLRKTLE